MSVAINIQARIDEVRAAQGTIEIAPKVMRQQTHIAMNQAAADAKRIMVKAVAERVAIPQRVINDGVVISRRATFENLEAATVVKESKRLSLKYFGASQTARGVTYRVSKNEGRKLLEGAFGPKIGKLGGHVYKRAGKSRLPLVKLYGVSAGAVFAKNDLILPTSAEVEARFVKRLRDRVRYVTLKQTGVIQ